MKKPFLAKQNISGIARRIAAALLEHSSSGSPLTADIVEHVVQTQMQHLWATQSARRNMANKMQKMIAEAKRIAAEPNRIYFCRDIGCDSFVFRFHIERQFRDGMTWDNYGDFWEIDHIKQRKEFDLTKKAQYLECSHYKNLRPLLRKENRQWRNPVPVQPLRGVVFRDVLEGWDAEIKHFK